jgi:hypothetical protein
MLLERMILDIDVRISELALKIGPTKIKEPENPETEKQVREIVRKIVLNPIFSSGLKKEKIIFEIISFTKCNQGRAKKIFSKMEELGLGLDREINDVITERYDLFMFAELREYLSDKEFDKVYEQIEKKEHFIAIMNKTQEKYEPKYGPDREKWPKEVLEETKKEFDAEF